VDELSEDVDLSQAKVTTAISRLEDVGLIEMLPTGEIVEREEHPRPEEAVEEAVEAEENHRAFLRSRIEMMRGYAETYDCRREYILNYFGEPFDPPCATCDNCDAGRVSPENEEDVPFPLNSRVVHTTLGSGLVERYEDGTIVILFDDVGYKTFDLNFLLEQDALKPD
jgi:ATP-dependent DNA helicase RecQ